MHCSRGIGMMFVYGGVKLEAVSYASYAAAAVEQDVTSI